MSQPRLLARAAALALMLALAACTATPVPPTPTTAPSPSAPLPATAAATTQPAATATPAASGPLVWIKNAASGAYLYEDGQRVKVGQAGTADAAAQWVEESFPTFKRFRNAATGDYLSIEHLLDQVEAIPVQPDWESARWTLDSDPAAGPTLIRSVWHNWEVLLAGDVGQALGHGRPTTNAAGLWSVALVNGQALASPTAPVIVALPTAVNPSGSRGAAVPWIEYEAEAGLTNGQVLGPDRNFGSLAAEASGRQAVQLSAVGDYSQIVATAPANALVVRYSLPDAPAGGGITATLSLYVDGAFRQKLTLTSRFAWSYGGDAYAFNTPGTGAHHFYDEARALIGSVPAGANLRLQKDADDSAASYVIDLVDLERVSPPKAMPPGDLNVVKDCGAVADDGLDDGPAIQKCIGLAQAQHTGVWLPAGTFESTRQPLSVAGVAIRGAGMWYTNIHGLFARFNCLGDGCQYFDFSILGETTERVDSSPDNGFNNGAGTGSRLENIWVEHTKVGYWAGPGTTNGLVITGSRFRDLMADGVNLPGGAVNTIIENSHFRNTGDDAIAAWSQQSGPPNINDVLRFNTVQMPWRANCFALYGGQDNTVEDNLCADVLAYPGLLVAQSFNSTPFTGTTTLARNTLVRAGGLYAQQPYGALELWAEQGPIGGQVVISATRIEGATYSGLELAGSNPISALSVDGLSISDAGSYGIQVGSAVGGAASFSRVTVSGSGQAALQNDSPAYHFKLTRGEGNSGW